MYLNVFNGYEDDEINEILSKINFEEKKDLYIKLFKKTFGVNSELLPTLEEINIISKTDIKNFLFKSIYNQNSFTVLNHEFLLKIVEIIKINNFKKVVELGSGTSIFSKWLNVYLKKDNFEVDVIALDKHEEDYFDIKNFFFETKNYDAIKHMNEFQEKDILYILGWPSLDTPFAFNVLNNLKFNNKILYIGEQKGGCTADDKFFDNLKNFKILEIKNYKSFTCIHDQPYLISKNKED